MPERTLFWVNGSIPSWQVMLALHEQGLPFESRRLKVMSTPKETRAPAFLAINPRGQAPVLVEDGVVVVESMAILHFLERRHPGLLPSEPAALARALGRAYEVERLRSAYRPLEMLFQPEALTPKRLAAARAAPERVREELGLWEARAAEAPFIAGEAFSFADVVFYPALAYQVRRGLKLEGFPRLVDYAARVGARPAAVAARPVGWGRKAGRDLFAEAGTLHRVRKT
ncbi:MAG: glutathione S-transferase family protein [Alphaproteobacteria bacterium]|nr:glutathione S-transferase family protein [Alphaproteobacteria bacterium]